MQHLNNEPLTARERLIPSICKSLRRAGVEMMLLLSLSCAVFVSCRTPDEIRPAVHIGEQGNAVIVTLPVGTLIQVPVQSDADRVAGALINESAKTNRAIMVLTPLKLVTSAYLSERDAAEMALHKRIAELEAKGSK
jgi:hypothetical protein